MYYLESFHLNFFELIQIHNSYLIEYVFCNFIQNYTYLQKVSGTNFVIFIIKYIFIWFLKEIRCRIIKHMKTKKKKF